MLKSQVCTLSKKTGTGPSTYLPARSDLDVNGGLAVPEDGDFFLWKMNHCVVSGRPDEHLLLPVDHTGRILQKTECFTEIFPCVILEQIQLRLTIKGDNEITLSPASQCRHRMPRRICRCWSAEISCRSLRCRNSRRSRPPHWASHQRCSVEERQHNHRNHQQRLPSSEKSESNVIYLYL